MKPKKKYDTIFSEALLMAELSITPNGFLVVWENSPVAILALHYVKVAQRQ